MDNPTTGEHGLFTLGPTSCDPASCKVDVVAVHGLHGHPLSTWTDSHGYLWLRDTLPAHVPDARIMSFGYDSASFASGQPQAALARFAEDLLARLRRARQDPLEQKRPLVFVCHGLGGVVAKHALVAAANGEIYQDLASNTAGIVFLGTPHRSSKSASLTDTMTRMVEATAPISASRPTASPGLLTSLSSTWSAFRDNAVVAASLVTTVATMASPTGMLAGALFGVPLAWSGPAAISAYPYTPLYGRAAASRFAASIPGRRTLEAQVIERTSRLARPILSRLSVVSFYEQRPRGSLVVDPFSAVVGLAGESAIPIDASHADLARVSPDHPNRYISVWASVKRIVEGCLPPKATEPDLTDALYSLDYKTSEPRIRRAHANTCDWIFENTAFCSFADSEGSAILVLTGPPGCGKTVLNRHICDEVRAGRQIFSDSDSANFCVDLFCSYLSHPSGLSERAVLRSLLHQLVQLHPPVLGRVRSRLPPGEKEESAETAVLWDAVADVLGMSCLANTLISIDSVEELGIEVAANIVSGFDTIVERFNDEGPSKRSRLRVLFSSRPDPPYLSRSVDSLLIPKHRVEQSIRRYLSRDIQRARRKDGWRLSAEAARIIEERLATRADGVFEWAVIAWKNLRRELSEGSTSVPVVRNKVRNLVESPPGLGQLYEQTLDSVPSELRDAVWATVSVMAVAKRPLTVAELAEILAIAASPGPGLPNPTELNPLEEPAQLKVPQLSRLLSVQGVGPVLSSSLSFREYLQTLSTDKPELTNRAEADVTRACLAYVTFRENIARANKDKTRPRRFPLFRYAHTFYLEHLLPKHHDDPLWLDFARTAGRTKFSPIHSLLGRCIRHDDLAVEKCHAIIRRLVLTQSYDLNNAATKRSGVDLNTCFVMAHTHDVYLNTIPLLLELGADPNLHPEGSDANLRIAILADNTELFHKLLSHPSFDPGAVDGLGRTALHHVMEGGATAWVRSLLDSVDVGAAVNAQDRYGSTPLHLAVTRGELPIVQRLLSLRGIKADLVDVNGRTPLALATFRGHNQIARTLTEHSKASSTSDDDGLLLAAQCGDKDAVSVLLGPWLRDHDSSFGLPLDESGQSILHHAAARNWTDVLEAILKSGFSADQIDRSGGTALHRSAALGLTESCEILLQAGASARLQDRNGRTAAQAAAEAGARRTLLALVRSGTVDVNQRDHQGRNLLHWAATVDCVEAIQLLCDMPGAEIARRDSMDRAPVDYAWLCQCPAVGRVLSPLMRQHDASWEDKYDWDRVYVTSTATAQTQKEYTESELEEIGRRTADQEWLALKAVYDKNNWHLVKAGDKDKKSKSWWPSIGLSLGGWFK